VSSDFLVHAEVHLNKLNESTVQLILLKSIIEGIKLLNTLRLE